MSIRVNARHPDSHTASEAFGPGCSEAAYASNKAMLCCAGSVFVRGTNRSQQSHAACMRPRLHFPEPPGSHHTRLRAGRLLLDLLDEAAHHGQADVGLKQRTTDLLQGLLHVLRGQLVRGRDHLLRALHAPAQRVEHGSAGGHGGAGAGLGKQGPRRGLAFPCCTNLAGTPCSTTLPNSEPPDPLQMHHHCINKTSMLLPGLPAPSLATPTLDGLTAGRAAVKGANARLIVGVLLTGRPLEGRVLINILQSSNQGSGSLLRRGSNAFRVPQSSVAAQDPAVVTTCGKSQFAVRLSGRCRMNNKSFSSMLRAESCGCDQSLLACKLVWSTQAICITTVLYRACTAGLRLCVALRCFHAQMPRKGKISPPVLPGA